ncbi:MAG: transglutaminase-like domain-containing protein [Rhodospirillales bacterium]|nr:transglutaminase-like domain-containing protein [Rhodospirillales bacterium]
MPLNQTGRFDLAEKVAHLANLPDDDFNLAETAVLLSANYYGEDRFQIHRDHLAELTASLNEEAERALAGAGLDELPIELQVSSLQNIFGSQFNYQGDIEDYDSPLNALMTDVIDRRLGLPVALGILFIQTSRNLGWNMQGLNFPGHFLVRLETHGQRRILDPFAGGMSVEPIHMRALLKGVEGNHAELKMEYFDSCSNRDILLRLQNNLKTRLLRESDYDRALDVIETNMMFFPSKISLWYESGLLKSRTGRLHGAIADFHYYQEHCQNELTRQKVNVLLAELNQQLLQ